MKRIICWLIGHTRNEGYYQVACARCGAYDWDELPESLHVDVWHALSGMRRRRRELRERIRRERTATCDECGEPERDCGCVPF